MDRVLNPKDEKKTIYEIYRACRLCGAGAGYKMPIIQSIVDLKSHGLDLRQKIKECVQIQVNHTDRMPPLICELCVDKVNDFYDFLMLCQQTNKLTRQRLGLPLQTKSRHSLDCENCIQGVTESISTDTDVECVSGQRNKRARAREPVEHVKIKIDTKKEVNKLVSKKKDTMLQDMAEKAKNEVSMPKNEGGLLKNEGGLPNNEGGLPKNEGGLPNNEGGLPKNEGGLSKNEGGLPKNEGSMLTKKAKRGNKQVLQEIPVPMSQNKKNKVLKSKYNKVEKEKENGRLALSSRSSTPDGQWERRRRSRSPANKRTTRQTADSISTDLQLIDAPLPEPKSKLKRPREKEVKIETPPPPNKKLKLPEPKPKETPKPGPKSRKPTKEPEPPKPAAKESAPLKTDPKPKPASKKDIKPSTPASKPSKTKSKPEPVKTKPDPVKTKPDPVKTKPDPVKTKPEEPVKAKPAPKPAETKFTCQICEHQVKTHQGLTLHNVIKHVPTFTAAKSACNACELWFPTGEECAAHHRAHRAGLPYKCHRCYGYFKLQLEYDNHFAEKLCLSVYEVPDVQCWRCYHRFATSSLLSAHHCPGEDGRPGGKCSKCNRSFALLKSQLKHEATCTHKKKGEVTIDPEVQARLLNMQVKISPCDALLSGPRVNVASIPHNYGLDRKARYPYLPAGIKRVPPTKAMLKANHMVSIDDSVKAEYWGSDSNDSQKVDRLTSMTLKSINKADKVDENDDLAKKIFSIIDNLDIDDGQTSCDSDNPEKVGDKKQSDGETKGDEKDNVSDGNDDSQGGSDSILDKNDGKSEDSSRVNDESDRMEVVKDIPESDSVVSGDIRVNSAVADVKSDKTDVGSDSIDANDKMDVDAEKVDVSPKESEADSVTIGDSDKMDVDCEKSDVSTQNVEVTSANSEDKLTTVVKRLLGSEDKTVDENDEKNAETDVKEKDDDVKPLTDDDVKPLTDDVVEPLTDDDVKSSTDDNDKALHETNKIFHDDFKSSENVDMTSKNDENNEQIRIETSQSTEEKLHDEESSNETQHLSYVNDNCSKNDSIDSSNQATQDCTLDFNKDKLESDSKEPDNINANIHKTDKIDVNHEETYPTLINNEVFSKIDEITNKILKETETSHDKSADENTAIEKTQKSDTHSDSISLNSLKSINDIELQDKFNVDDLSDDDKKLMAELDAQIGEINEKHDKDDVSPNLQNKEDQNTSENDGGGSNHNDNAGVNDIAGNNDNAEVNDIAAKNDNAEINDIAAKNDNAEVNDIAGKNDNYDNQGADTNCPAVNSSNQNGPSNNHMNGTGSNDQKSKDYLIDNLLRKQDDLKSLELDSISDDDFNFDA